MRLVQSLVLALAVGVVLAPKSAQAAYYRLGLGADYWFEKSGLFNLTLGVYEPVVRHFSVGGRFGAAYVTDPSTVALPLDLVLHGDIGRMYLEGVVGPWIFFTGTAVRAHVGAGFGLHTRHLSVGLELAYLDPNAIIGLRLAFPL
jgi:hypothetical protein